MNSLWKSFFTVTVMIATACSPAADTAPPRTSDGAPPDTTVTVVEEAPARETTGSTPSVATPEPERNIYIDAVEAGNPLVVKGRARTFENNVVFRVRGRDGVIAQGFTTSEGEMGRHNPFTGTLWITRDPGPAITVEALEYSARDGSETNLTRVERPFAIEPVNAVLHFADDKCTGVTAYQRRIPKSVSMARLLVEALIAGPTAEERSRGAVPMFPQGSAVQSVNLKDGVLTVDFNERLQNVGGSCRAQMIRASVTETLRRLPSVKSVVIKAGGSEKLALQP